MKTILLATAALLSMATAAQAVTPTLVEVTPSSGLYEFTYEATLGRNEGVRLGDRLVIFDFAGFAGFGVKPSSLILTSTEATTTVGNALNQLRPVPDFTDDPNLPNLVLQWSGPDVFTMIGHPPIDFTFSAFSTFGRTTADGFTAVTVSNSLFTRGSPVYEQGSVGVPLAVIPEPAAWAMMILGFGGVGAVSRRRRTLGFA
jgi:hypothetical protein